MIKSLVFALLIAPINALLLVLLLSSCKEGEPTPFHWDQNLDPYMAELGYTLDSNREVILKNGYSVWADAECYRCNGNYPLVPDELAEAVRQDFISSYKTAKENYAKSIGVTIGIAPVFKQEEPK
jgi:hypothetical protein